MLFVTDSWSYVINILHVSMNNSAEVWTIIIRMCGLIAAISGDLSKFLQPGKNSRGQPGNYQKEGIKNYRGGY